MSFGPHSQIALCERPAATETHPIARSAAFSDVVALPNVAITLRRDGYVW